MFSDTVAAGLVASSIRRPAPQVPRGASVTVAVSKGPDVVTVPNVVGMDLTTAVATLTPGRADPGDHQRARSTGKVLATNPGPTAVVKRGTAVEIVMA